MAKICEPCGYYSADNAPTTCPTCSGSLRVTLLPPRGYTPAPLADVAADSARPRNRHPKEGFWDGLGIDKRIVGCVFSVLLGLGLFAWRQYERQERYAKVTPGMHISEAAKLLDTGKGMHHPNTVRFRDRFGPNDRSTGTTTVQEGREEIVIRWENGVVTSVYTKDAGSGGGMRRRATVVTEDPDVDEDTDEGDDR